jgi:hypothetical protein
MAAISAFTNVFEDMEPSTVHVPPARETSVSDWCRMDLRIRLADVQTTGQAETAGLEDTQEQTESESGALAMTRPDQFTAQQIAKARKRYDDAATMSFDELARIQGYRAEDAPKELPAEGWTYLVARRHPWRRQLFVKGRNLTVRQLIGTVKVENWNDQQAAQALDLAEEAIREARRYAEMKQELLAAEAEYERLVLEQKG